MTQSTQRTTWVLVHTKYNELSNLIKKVSNEIEGWRTEGAAEDEEYYTALENLLESIRNDDKVLHDGLVTKPDTIVSREDYPTYLHMYSYICDTIVKLETQFNRGL